MKDYLVEHMSKSVTNTQVLADLKLWIASYEVSRKIRCDIVTILGVSEDASIKSAIAEAHNNGKELLVDMIAVQNLEQRELVSIILQYILVMIYKLKVYHL